MKFAFNPFSGKFDWVVSNLTDIDTRQHSDLTNLTWSTAGHTIDTNVDFVGNQLLNCGTININATSDHSLYNSSDDFYIKNPNSNKAIYFNINKGGTNHDFIKINSSLPQFLITNSSGINLSTGIFSVMGSWNTGIAAYVMDFNPTITSGNFYGFYVRPTLNTAGTFQALAFEPTFGTNNRNIQLLRIAPPAHASGYNDVYTRYNESFTRTFFAFSNDAATITYNPFDIGGALTLGDTGVTNVAITETMIKLSGGSSRAFGTGGSITQKGLLFSGFGTIATNTTVRALEADGGLFSFKYDYSTTSRILLGAGEDMGFGYDGTKGIIDTSLVAASDLSIACGTDKTLVLTETVWDDVRVTPSGFDRAGIADPSLVSYTPTGSSIATYLYEFQKDDIAYFTVQLPHSYKEGTNINCHIHWTPGLRGNEESGNTVGWKVDYAWANIDGTFGAMSTVDLSDACDGTDDKHQMTPSVAITGTSKNISSMLICNVKRTDTGTDDTWVGTASGQLPMLLEIDFHYEIDTMGSRQAGIK